MNPLLEFDVVPRYWYRVIDQKTMEPIGPWLCFSAPVRICYETPGPGNYGFKFMPMDPSKTYPTTEPFTDAVARTVIPSKPVLPA